MLRGAREEYSQGSIWLVGDQHGYAELLLMHDSKAYHPKTLYIEDIRVKEEERRKGYGTKLYQKIEQMARNMDLDYIQIDSEPSALEFWHKMSFHDIDAVYYQNKTAMVKEIK